jgi:hypothetical protein
MCYEGKNLSQAVEHVTRRRGRRLRINPSFWMAPWLDLAKLYFDLQQVSIYDNNNIRIYIYIVVIFLSCSIFFLWDTVRWSIHFCFKQDFRSWDGHLTWDGTSNARLQGLGSMGTRAPGRWLGYAKFRFYRLVDRGWMDVEGISVTLWDVLISFDDLEGVSSNKSGHSLGLFRFCHTTALFQSWTMCSEVSKCHVSLSFGQLGGKLAVHWLMCSWFV